MRDRPFSSFYLSSSSGRPPLRIGILLDRILDRATSSVVEDILASDFARPVIVLFDAGPETMPPPAAAWTLRQRRRGRLWPSSLALRAKWARLAWDVYVQLDRRRVRLANDPLAAADRGAVLEGLDASPVHPIVDGSGFRLPADTIDRIRAARLDVLLHLGTSEFGGLVDVASNGCWSFRHGDGDRYLGDPPHFWEMVDGTAVTAVILERRGQTPDDALVLATAQFATDMGSLARNRVMPYFGSTHLVIRKLWELHQFGWQHLAEQARHAASPDGRLRRAGVPANRELVGWLLPRVLGSVARRLVGRLTVRDKVDQWQMAIRTEGPGLTADGSLDMSGFHWVPAPTGRFYADPFVVERDGRTWLFFEDYEYAEGRGVISCAEVGADGRLEPSEVVLETAGHLSYPYVFFDGDVAWMIPESAAEGTVQLYRATDFPHVWEPQAEIFAGPALDSSVWQEDGLWWLFLTLREPRGGATMLWLFYAESLRGPWTFHPRNPISADVRWSRGAGAIHRRHGRLVRPSQDGSRGYGFSFSLNEITTLSPTAYQEHPIVTVTPDWAPSLVATHTYNRSGPIEVTDAKVRRARRDAR